MSAANRPANHWFLVPLLLCLTASLPTADEINLPGAIRAKMDQWELNTLNKADQAFVSKDKNQWTKAAASYELFIEQFPQSQALAYALYRQGRCLHLDNKRNAARRIYDDILDFFPNEVAFAAAAAYYKGLSYKEDGDGDKAIKAWSRIAKDKDYRSQPLSAFALNELAEYLLKRKRYDDAADNLLKVATTFRTRNRDAAISAIDQLRHHYIRRVPNEPQLRSVYHKVKSFNHNPPRDFSYADAEAVLESEDYWRQVYDHVRRHGRFDQLQEAEKRQYYGYWAERMENRFPKWDDFQIARLEFKLASDGDQEAWMAGIDKQFADYQKPGDNGRIRKWMEFFRGNTKKLEEYYTKFDWKRMKPKEAMVTCRFLYERGTIELGNLALQKVPIGDLADGDKAEFGEFLYSKLRDRNKAEMVINQIEREDFKFWTLLNMYAKDKSIPAEEKLVFANALDGSKEYAGEASFIKGDILKEEKQYAAAISAYLASDKAPDANFEVAECFMLDGNLGRAIGELEGIEGAFKKSASSAALIQAKYYDKFKDEKNRNGTLIRILKAYPGTREHSAAHQWAERLGLSFKAATR